MTAMQLALVILLFAAGALAQDVPFEQLHALLDYDRSAVGRVLQLPREHDLPRQGGAWN